jgi:hypothetical protein
VPVSQATHFERVAARTVEPIPRPAFHRVSPEPTAEQWADDLDMCDRMLLLIDRYERTIRALQIEAAVARAQFDTLRQALDRLQSSSSVPRPVGASRTAAFRFDDKACQACGATFTPGSGSQKFCRACPVGVRRPTRRLCACGAKFNIGRRVSDVCRICEAKTAPIGEAVPA